MDAEAAVRSAAAQGLQKKYLCIDIGTSSATGPGITTFRPFQYKNGERSISRAGRSSLQFWGCSGVESS